MSDNAVGNPYIAKMEVARTFGKSISDKFPTIFLLFSAKCEKVFIYLTPEDFHNRKPRCFVDDDLVVKEVE